MKTAYSCAKGNYRPRKLGVGLGNALPQNWKKLLFLLSMAFCFSALTSHATVTSISVQSPSLSANGTNSLTTPVHFLATAESDLNITGYVIYVDGQIVFQNAAPFLDTWVIPPPSTNHSLYITAWDSSGSALSSVSFQVNIEGAVVPTPPASATRILGIDASKGWAVDNNPGVGGQCNDGSIGKFQSASDPDTSNAPDFNSTGQHFIVQSKCKYDDSLFYISYSNNTASDTNFLWDFWFYIPTTTLNSELQALENDLYQTVKMSDGVHEFMFGSQCDYATNQWQFWLPKNGTLTWMNAGLSPCQFSTGTWHHATYFLQRVTPATGYQKIPASFNSSDDSNSSLRFGTLTVDGNTMYLGGLADSVVTNPPWAQVLGVQHQLDSDVSGVKIEEYVDNESVVTW